MGVNKDLHPCPYDRSYDDNQNMGLLHDLLYTYLALEFEVSICGSS